MRRLPVFVLALAVLSIMLSACDRKSAEPVGVPDYESGLTDRAWLVLDTGGEFSEALGIQQEAVRLLREGKSREDPVAVLEQMAYFLFSKGSLEEAYSYFCEAEDSLLARRWPAPTESAVMLYGDMSQFYHRLGMIERAMMYSDSAMAVSRRMDGLLMPDLWRFRTQIYANTGDTAAAFACLDSARSAVFTSSSVADTARMLSLIDCDRANIILSLKTSPDSVALAADILSRGLATRGEADFADHLGALGFALYLRGEKDEGIRLMETAVDRLQASGDLEISLLETRRLIDVYNEENDESKLNALYPAFTALNDSMNRLHRDIDYATAHVRAAITTARQENDALKKQLDEHRRSRALTWIAVASALLAAIVAGIFVSRRIRRRHEPGSPCYVTDEHEVRDVAGDRYPSTDPIEMHSVSAGPEVAGHNIKIDKDSGALRRAFDAIYPQYIERLRGDFPSLTDTDIVFCMLICLRYSTGEIADGLNISRASVNSARYRIRTKLNLSKEDNLDRYLHDRTAVS